MPFRNLKLSLYYGRHHALQTKDSRETDLTWKLPPGGLTFIVPEGAMQAVSGEKQLTILPSYKVCESQQGPVWQDSPKGATVALIC